MSPSTESTQRRSEELDYLTRGLELRSFNRVVPLRDGREAFPAMIAAIRAAQHHVHFETYTLVDDRVGREFRDALIERRRAGVAVRLLYDAVGSFELPSSFVDQMRRAGIVVLEFNPLPPWRARWSPNRRDHQKILVVDDHVAFTGGINVGLDYAPAEDGGGGWRDQAVRVEGPIVFDLARTFRRTWLLAGGPWLPEPRMPRSYADTSEHTSEVALVHNLGVLARARTRATFFRAFGQARRSISIMSAYFIPGRPMRRLLRAAARRGVQVRVIVPERSDVRLAQLAGRHLYERLLVSGVTLLEWPERMMHAKIALVDGTWSAIGSYNVDQRSLRHNLEAAVIALDRAIGAQLEEQFEEDAARCTEVTLEACHARHFTERWLQWLAYRFRYWL